LSSNTARDIEKLPQQLANPLKYRFRAILFVAENQRRLVEGFALLLHDPQLQFGYLEYISTASQLTGRGIGGALYQRVREETRALGSTGLFFECLPDDPDLCRDPATLKENRARLRFYERYGARPIVGTAYETPVKEGGG
jgi:GNAT superfamily N-acetyltransferase